MTDHHLSSSLVDKLNDALTYCEKIEEESANGADVQASEQRTGRQVPSGQNKHLTRATR